MRFKTIKTLVFTCSLLVLTACGGDKSNTKSEKEATKVIEGDTTDVRKEKEGSLGHRFMEPDSL